MGLAELFTATSLALGLPQGLLSSICYVESNHNVKAVHYQDGNGTSIGLCQVKATTARMVGSKVSEARLYNAEVNIRAAGAYLKHGYASCGSWLAATYYYNRGRCPKQTHIQGYTARVLARWAKDEEVPAHSSAPTSRDLQQVSRGE